MTSSTVGNGAPSGFGGPSSIEIQDDGIDLVGVHPLRRRQTLERIRAIVQWLASEDRDGKAEAKAAAGLGVGVPMFRRIVRAWLDHGRAADLPGARVPTTKARRLNPAASAEAEAIVAALIAHLGPAARPADVAAEAARRCEAAGLTSPSAVTIASRVYRARALSGDAPGRDGIVVDHCALRLPVFHEGRVRAPVATLAFLRDGTLLSWSLGIGGPYPQTTARTLAAALRAPAADGPAAGLRMTADHTPGWGRVLDALRAAGVHRAGRIGAPVPSGREARAVFGDAIAGLPLVPGLTHSDADARFASRLSSPPLPLDEARAAFADALADYGISAGPGRRPRIASDEDEGRLVRALDAIADEEPEPPRRRRRA